MIIDQVFTPFSALSITQWLAPEVISFFSSIIIFIVLKRASGVTIEAINGDVVEGGNQNQIPDGDNDVSLEKWKLLIGAGKVLSLLALCATGALQPSIPSVVYYIVFLGAATWWGCNKELERCETIFCLNLYSTHGVMFNGCFTELLDWF